MQAQALLTLSIPNYPPSRQEKSLDYVLACVVDKIMKKRLKNNRTSLVNCLYCHNVSDQSRQAKQIASNREQMPSKYQNSSKNHLFLEPKNTLLGDLL